MVNGVVATVISGALLVAFSGNGIAGGPAHTETSKIALATAHVDREKAFRDFQVWLQNIPTAVDREKLFREFQARLQNIPTAADREKVFRDFQAWLKSPPPPIAPAVAPAPPAEPVITKGKPGEIKLASVDPDQLFADFNTWFRGPVPAAAAAPTVPIPVAVAPPRAATGPGDKSNDKVAANDKVAEPIPSFSFEANDKIKLLVYEKLPDAELSKYGKTGFSEDNFQQRSEMSGEFLVSQDETLSVPMLGTFSVTGTTPQQLEAALAKAYREKMNREGFITIMDVTRPAVSILGPVKTPGKLDYTPGMTVIHAVAAAGGIKNGVGDDEPWTRLDIIREKVNHAAAEQTMADLLARRAVLEGELNQVAPIVPEALVTLVGPTRAKAMIATEQDRRRTIIQARRQQVDGLDAQLQTAKQQIALLQNVNLVPYDDAVKLAERRAAAMQQFSERGTINNVQLQGAQVELLTATTRRDEIQTRLREAQNNVARLEIEKALAQKTALSDITTSLESVRREIAAAQEKSVASEGLLRALNGGPISVAFSPDTGQDSNVLHYAYKIVRTTKKGPVTIPATDLTVLAPGDLVEVMLASPASSASDTMPTFPLPEHPKATPANAIEKR